MIDLDGLPVVTIAVLLVLPIVMLAAMLALVRSFMSSPLTADEDAVEPDPRPWWGSPVVWIAAGAAFLLLGLFVVPHFLGGIVLFLPFFWVGGGRRPRARR